MTLNDRQSATFSASTTQKPFAGPCRPSRPFAGQHASTRNTLTQLDGHRILKVSALLFALWIPWIVALYPGSMIWDTYYQIWQCYPEGHPIYFIPWGPTESTIDNYFSDHHPIFDTLVFGAFARFSDLLFGSWNYGVFAFVLIQAIGTAISLSAGIEYLRAMDCPRTLRIGIAALYAFLPFYGCYAGTMIKDTFFSWLYIPWFLIAVEVARTKGVCLNQRSTFIWFLSLCLLLCLTKKTGLYVVAFTLAVLGISSLLAWRERERETTSPQAKCPKQESQRIKCGEISLLSSWSLPYLLPGFDVCHTSALRLSATRRCPWR